MTVLFAVFILASLVYAGVVLLFRFGLRFPSQPQEHNQPLVSVVIAVRNEEKNLPELLAALRQQRYPLERWELIIVDDNSTDGTQSLLQAALKVHPNLKIFSLLGTNTPLRYKKAALAVGIHNAQGEIILTTDADCRMGPDWIATMAGYFTAEVGIVVGYSAMEGIDNLLVKWQSLDYLMLMAAAQGITNLGFAWACSGQNWAFRKALFDRVGGYQLLHDRTAGDDTLFMQIIKKKTRARAIFAAHPGAWVRTEALPELKSFLRQRIRWSSEANYIHRINPLFFLVILATFLSNLAPLLLLLLWLVGLKVGGLALGLLGIKLAAEGLLAARALKVYHREDLRMVFPLWFITQMPYVVFMGLASFWGNRIGWKTEH